jgi:hypothetical protein
VALLSNEPSVGCQNEVVAERAQRSPAAIIDGAEDAQGVAPAVGAQTMASMWPLRSAAASTLSMRSLRCKDIEMQVDSANNAVGMIRREENGP